MGAEGQNRDSLCFQLLNMEELWLHLAVLIRKGMWSDLWAGKTTGTRAKTALSDGGVEGEGVWRQVLAGEKGPKVCSWHHGGAHRNSSALCIGPAPLLPTQHAAEILQGQT